MAWLWYVVTRYTVHFCFLPRYLWYIGPKTDWYDGPIYEFGFIFCHFYMLDPHWTTEVS